MSEKPFKVGASKKKITPTPDMGPVYRAGYKMGEAERLTGIVDDTFLRCLTVENAATRIIFVSLDLIGLFRDFTDELAAIITKRGIEAGNLLVATTHIHSGPDTMGVWGPSFDTSGYNDRYGEFLLQTAADAITESLASARQATGHLFWEEKNLGIANYREPDELSLALWCLRFEADGETIGSLISYTAQPELAPRHDDKISAGYPGEACRILDEKLGGITLFLLGACGGMEPEGCEQGYELGHAYGRKLADEVLRGIKIARPIAGSALKVETREIGLAVENPGFQLMMEAGVIRTSQKPPNARTTISKVAIGDIAIFALPGESFPGIVAGIGEKGHALFINQVNDSLGYFIPPEQFRSEPTEWAEGHHFTGHELESLGRSAGETIRRELVRLASG
jgi:hypothetical protein